MPPAAAPSGPWTRSTAAARARGQAGCAGTPPRAPARSRPPRRVPAGAPGGPPARGARRGPVPPGVAQLGRPGRRRPGGAGDGEVVLGPRVPGAELAVAVDAGLVALGGGHGGELPGGAGHRLPRLAA